MKTTTERFERDVEELVETMNSENWSMDKATRELSQDEPNWFDFSEWYERVPIAGFYDGKAILLDNTQVHDRDNEWTVIGPEYSGGWKR
jgi:hypothetical protein